MHSFSNKTTSELRTTGSSNGSHTATPNRRIESPLKPSLELPWKSRIYNATMHGDNRREIVNKFRKTSKRKERLMLLKLLWHRNSTLEDRNKYSIMPDRRKVRNYHPKRHYQSVVLDDLQKDVSKARFDLSERISKLLQKLRQTENKVIQQPNINLTQSSKKSHTYNQSDIDINRSSIGNQYKGLLQKLGFFNIAS